MSCKKIILIILGMFILPGSLSAQTKIAPEIIEILTMPDELRTLKDYYIPVVVMSEHGPCNVIALNGQLYDIYARHSRVSPEEFCMLLKNVLSNNDTLEICAEELLDVYGNLPMNDMSAMKEKNVSILERKSRLGKEAFLAWAFDDEQAYKYARSTLPTVVRILMSWNVLVSIGCEFFSFYYEDCEKESYIHLRPYHLESLGLDENRLILPVVLGEM